MKRPRMQITPPEALPDLFSQSRYAAAMLPARTLLLNGTRKEIRARLRENCQELPGVYGMVSSTGQLIYVGMSGNLRRRLHSYFSSKVSRTKERRIGHRSTTLIWQPVAHEIIARLRERELIRLYRPNYNVQGHPTQMKLGYITLLDQSAPCFALQPHLPRKHAGVWGPIPITKFLRQAVSELNHHFQLRDCPKDTPIRFANDPVPENAPTFTPCMRADLGTCLAPCIGACTRTAYSRMLTASKKFLNGDAETTFAAIQSEMRQAVEQRRYEKAAVLRDRMQAFERISQHLRRFHDWTSRANFLYPVTSVLDNREWWLIVSRGVAIELVPRPQNAESALELQKKLAGLSQQVSGAASRAIMMGPDEFTSSRLLFRWFRLYPDEKERQLSLAKAQRVCQSIFGKES